MRLQRAEEQLAARPAVPIAVVARACGASRRASHSAGQVTLSDGAGAGWVARVGARRSGQRDEHRLEHRVG
ncbi:MAG: hypothetical protein LC790_19290 [Actinobacteria bacterium]|nr:hypothetical protein [Actinomycetota bacterium]